METRTPGGKTFHAPTLPLALDGKRLPKRSDPPAIGEGARELLASLGYNSAEIADLQERTVVALP
jgi:crotonobetainyl-CoA:carnitine CoA-transferase CaiB-like acyl-CoA transferase